MGSRSPRVEAVIEHLTGIIDNPLGIGKRELVPPDEPRSGFTSTMYVALQEIRSALAALNMGDPPVINTAWVDQHGDDDWLGTVEMPVATVQAAHDLLLERNPTEPGVIFVGPGTFAGDVEIILSDLVIRGVSRDSSRIQGKLTCTGVGAQGCDRLAFKQISLEGDVEFQGDAYTFLFQNGLSFEEVFWQPTGTNLTMSPGTAVVGAALSFRQCLFDLSALTSPSMRVIWPFNPVSFENCRTPHGTVGDLEFRGVSGVAPWLPTISNCDMPDTTIAEVGPLAPVMQLIIDNTRFAKPETVDGVIAMYKCYYNLVGNSTGAGVLDHYDTMALGIGVPPAFVRGMPGNLYLDQAAVGPAPVPPAPPWLYRQCAAGPWPGATWVAQNTP